MDKRVCGKCKLNLPVDSYSIKRDGGYYKTCDYCRNVAKNYRAKKRCLHNKYFYSCISCKTYSNELKCIE